MDESRVMGIINQLMTELKKNQELQKLAEENGVAYKVGIQYNDDTIENIVTSMVALTLAKMSKDKQYELLVRQGIAKRSLKTELINKYKDQALMYINKYKEAPPAFAESI